jgi:hypothetical protein
LQFDIGLSEIDLSGCDLIRPIPSLAEVSLKEIVFLGLNRPTSISLGFLVSLFDVFVKFSVAVVDLDLSYLGLEAIDEFLEYLGSCSVRGLKVFSFDGNEMNSVQTLGFVKFLRNQPDLVSLSLSCSINISDSPSGLSAFLRYLSEHRIRDLSLRGDFCSLKFSFGKLLLPFLSSSFAQSVECLDLSGQNLGESGLDCLGKLLEQGSLLELKFDGSSVQSFDALCLFCERVLASSSLRHATFPEHDFTNLLTLVDPRLDFGSLEEKKRKTLDGFEKKFGHSWGKAKSMSSSSFSLAAVSENEEVGCDRKVVLGEGNLVDYGLEYATEMDAELEKLFGECMEGLDVGDPMRDVINRIEECLEFGELVAAAAAAIVE